MSDLLLPHDAALERLRALHPIKIDLSLGRTLRLLDDLGRPQDRLPPVIHVAGTNGKGSTIAFLRAIAEAAGLRVHVMISPHLVRFAERIRLAGTLINDDQLTDVIARVEKTNAGQPITFFEITTVAAFQAFTEVPADLCLIEVGLGGRFDSTNVIARPAVSVIAPVDIDHREYLGDTLAAIAGEKAGIIKPGRPVVSARQREEASAVIEAEAERQGAPLTLGGRDFDAWAERGGMAFQGGERLYDLPAPSLPGPHQIDNAGTAIAAALALDDPRITEAAIAEGLRPRRVARPHAAPDRRSFQRVGQGARRGPVARRRAQSARGAGDGGGGAGDARARRASGDADRRPASAQGRGGGVRRVPGAGSPADRHRLRLGTGGAAGERGRRGAGTGRRDRTRRADGARHGAGGGQTPRRTSSSADRYTSPARC